MFAIIIWQHYTPTALTDSLHLLRVWVSLPLKSPEHQLLIESHAALKAKWLLSGAGGHQPLWPRGTRRDCDSLCL